MPIQCPNWPFKTTRWPRDPGHRKDRSPTAVRAPASTSRHRGPPSSAGWCQQLDGGPCPRRRAPVCDPTPGAKRWPSRFQRQHASQTLEDKTGQQHIARDFKNKSVITRVCVCILQSDTTLKLIVLHLQQHVIDSLICTGRHSGKRVLIPRITLSPSDTGFPFTLRRRQFPVRPAFSMTINKSQGQTLDHVGLYLPEPVFTHGQLHVYVALSRARSFDSITVVTDKCTVNATSGQLQYETVNTVYKEIFN